MFLLLKKSNIMRMWEIREGYDRPEHERREFEREGYGRRDEIEEAYYEGFDDGYREALEGYGQRGGSMGNRGGYGSRGGGSSSGGGYGQRDDEFGERRRRRR